MTAAVETRPFWDLSRHTGATALVVDGAEIGYDDLADRVARLAARLGGTRRLVLLEAANDVAGVVGYLACLVGHHPVLVAAPGSTTAAARAAYDPDVVLAGEDLVEQRPGTRHDLHPDLAVLLSTSGSTGSPKLVRLSRDAVAANARAIAEALAIRSDDVAATALPLHYCYGLSVLTSHLEVGASVLLTSASVVDPGFWDDARRHRVSTVPGVPHTFDLLDRAGFADLDLPALRYLTCAGGRLPAATATRYAELGLRRGFDLFLMYGATEATARMAVLAPDRVLAHPTLLGDPVAGGSFEVRPVEGVDHAGPGHGGAGAGEPVPGSGGPSADTSRAGGSRSDGAEPVGELVYRGENVMLGYAETPADLARGRDVDELRTGDLVRRTPDGLEVVGRLGRIAKVFGLRIDLDRLEAGLRTAGVVGHAADAGDRVVIGVDRSARPLSTADLDRVLDAAARTGVPAAGCVVVELDGVPRRANGKVDHAAIADAGRRARGADLTADDRAPVSTASAPKATASSALTSTAPAPKATASSALTSTAPAPLDASGTPAGGRGAEAEAAVGAVAAVLAGVGRGPWHAEDTFVSRGGDSLSYVETSLRLERLLGHLPVRWHLLTAAELAGRAAGRDAERVAGRGVGRAAGRGTGRTDERAALPGPVPMALDGARAARPGGRTVAEVARRTATATRRTSSVETNVLLRALAIVLIVGSHSNLFMVLGGAHVLVGLAGFNLARFHLVDRERADRVRSMLTSVARVAVPTVLWLGFAAATSAKYDWRNVVLLNGVLGTREWSEAWHYWFVEALVWTLLAVVALLAVPAVHRLERRAPFWFPVALVVLALPARYDVVRFLDGDYIHRGHVIFWLFALGWATAQARRPLHRVVVSVLAVATVPGFFDHDLARETVVVAGLLLLVWVPSLRVPAALARLAGTLAGASLYIYLCHWQIYPAYEFSLPWLATGLSLLAGVVFWRLTATATPYVERGLARAAALVPVTRVTPTGGEEIADDPPRFSPRRCLTRDATSAREARVVG